MLFQPHQIYHVFNQGNNRQRIFFKRENYLFFLRKMRCELLPYVDLLAYCLMPNHFHWLLCPKPGAEANSRAVKPRGFHADPNDFQSNLSHAIGILLSSYTRAINIQENRSGSLFRAKTKIRDGWPEKTKAGFQRHPNRVFYPGNDHARQCFYYIHQNPVKARLVTKPEEWEFSSARDYAGGRMESLCNCALTQMLLEL